MSQRRAPNTYRVGARVFHTDANRDTAVRGTVVKLTRACVGAPYMVRVHWDGKAEPSHSINARLLEIG